MENLHPYIQESHHQQIVEIFKVNLNDEPITVYLEDNSPQILLFHSDQQNRSTDIGRLKVGYCTFTVQPSGKTLSYSYRYKAL